MDSLLIGPFAPTTSRACHRITNVFATSLESDDLLGAAGNLPSSSLKLGRMQRFYDRCSQQLPRVAARRALSPEGMTFSWDHSSDYTFEAVNAWLFDVPAGPVVLALTVDVGCARRALIPLLEAFYYCQVTFSGLGAEDLAHTMALENADLAMGATRSGRLALAPEIHQIVHLGSTAQPHLPVHDELQRLIYRADLDCVERYSDIKYPNELNRRPSSLAAVGPFVSVLVAQQDYIENGCFLSAVQLVAAAAKVRDIREATRSSLVELTELSSNSGGAERRGNDVRVRLARSAERLAQQELQLTFGVESSRAFSMLIPSLRLDSYHQTLVAALSLNSSSAVVSDMLGRLRAVIAAETNSLQSYLGRREELRRLRWGAIIGLFSAVAVPVGIVLSFFGGQAAEVTPHTSIFNIHLYLGLYAFICLMFISSALIFTTLLFKERSELKQLRAR